VVAGRPEHRQGSGRNGPDLENGARQSATARSQGYNDWSAVRPKERFQRQREVGQVRIDQWDEAICLRIVIAGSEVTANAFAALVLNRKILLKMMSA
jgi:hypothetical protein